MKKIISITALLALCSCSNLAMLPDAQNAISTTNAALAADTSKNTSILTKAQLSACAAQADANLLTDYLTSQGKTTASQYSAVVSQTVGLACTWKAS